jgi:hypothetical protein
VAVVALGAARGAWTAVAGCGRSRALGDWGTKRSAG